ncbi:hypothetical protein HANVADRAFT_21044 [Hanseniaspora valbyensis NRRL Y-1626]|uniref:Uncharacterized protein n=1 Tax=Hanseniaspora valbyensis NRRL Y-1626 TaxID=766949 RepID=A0A1B7TJ25_9ASCO|nr:hypothetical protein HANVADRAFT_21044 [Hanseniaspora valbyensis NRRL Y-1626]
MSSSENNEKKYTKRKKSLWKIVPILAISITLILYLLSFFYSSIFSSDNLSRLDEKYVPKTRGLYSYEIKQQSPLIFPVIENQPALKKVGLKVLFTKGTQGNYVVNVDQKPLTEKEKKQLLASDDQNDKTLFIKNQFLDHGKAVYDGNSKESPDTVIVTLVDFETYGLDSTVKVVQNRVDYAQKQKYGVYVRWAQEFIPFLEDQDLNKQINQDYVKFLMMRQAMNAFPHAKIFWFLDKNSLIMDLNLSLDQQLFDITNKEMIDNELVYLNSPVVQNAVIKTHNNIWKENAKSYSDVQFLPIETLDVSSFIMKNDLYAHAMLDYINDPLFKQYSWQSIQQVLSHAFEWHPSLIRSLLLVKEKILGAYYDPQLSTETSTANTAELGVGKNDAYKKSDLVIKFRDCLKLKTCNSLLTEYYSQVTK